MDESTKAEYRKIATRFYSTMHAITPSSIEIKLGFFADKYSKTYWAKIRRAIAFDQKEKGYSKPSQLVAKIKYPKDSKVVKKPRRIKRVSLEDADAFFKSKAVPGHLKCAIRIVRMTGCRPAEILKINTMPGGKFVIYGVKKSTSLQRGSDRTILIEDSEQSGRLSRAITLLKEWSADKKAPQAALQDLLAVHSKKIFPRRVARPSFYSFRHQFGSDLKASDLSTKERSYLMGHQSSASISTYGNKRSSNSSSAMAVRAANIDVAEQVVRDKSKPIPNPKLVKQHSPSVGKHLKPSGYSR